LMVEDLPREVVMIKIMVFFDMTPWSLVCRLCKGVILSTETLGENSSRRRAHELIGINLSIYLWVSLVLLWLQDSLDRFSLTFHSTGARNADSRRRVRAVRILKTWGALAGMIYLSSHWRVPDGNKRVALFAFPCISVNWFCG
jgi:hypothetical protein